MKKVIKINDRYEIVHIHRNFQRETDFMAWDIKKDMAVDGPMCRIIRVPNCAIDWDNPLTDEEIQYLIKGV